MTLDSIRKLTSERLRKTLNDNGFDEIAKILGNLGLNGSELLESTEFQSISWKVTPLQRKQLRFFIKQLKADPSILKVYQPSIPTKSKVQSSAPGRNSIKRNPKPDPSAFKIHAQGETVVKTKMPISSIKPPQHPEKRNKSPRSQEYPPENEYMSMRNEPQESEHEETYENVQTRSEDSFDFYEVPTPPKSAEKKPKILPGEPEEVIYEPPPVVKRHLAGKKPPVDGEDNYERNRSLGPREINLPVPSRDRSVSPHVSPVSVIANRKPIPTPTRENRADQKSGSVFPSPQLDKPARLSKVDAFNSTGAIKKVPVHDRFKSSYENHLLTGTKQVTNVKSPITKRPLPPLPTETISTPKSSLNNNHFARSKPSEYVELIKNHEIDYDRKEVDDEPDDVYENLKPASNSPGEELYLNCPKLSPSPQREPPKGFSESNKEALRNQLAIQLASELLLLKKNNQQVEGGQNTMRSGIQKDNRQNNRAIIPLPVLPKPPAIMVAHNTDDRETDESDDEYVKSIFNVNNEPFFRNTDRKGAKMLLKNLGDGAFLFRPSQNYFLVLSIKWRNKYYNLGIVRTENEKITLSSDVGSAAPQFSSLEDFVDYFTKEEVTFREGNELMGTVLKRFLPPDQF